MADPISVKLLSPTCFLGSEATEMRWRPHGRGAYSAPLDPLAGFEGGRFRRLRRGKGKGGAREGWSLGDERGKRRRKRDVGRKGSIKRWGGKGYGNEKAEVEDGGWDNRKKGMSGKGRG